MSLSVLSVINSGLGFWTGVVRANLQIEAETAELALPPKEEN